MIFFRLTSLVAPSCEKLGHKPGQPLYPFSMMSGGRYTALGGGVPLTSQNSVVAGVGVRGGTADHEMAIVEAALK